LRLMPRKNSTRVESARAASLTLTIAMVAAGLLSGAAAIKYPSSITFKPLAFAGFIAAAMCAGWLAWFDAIRGARMVTWDPTPRPTVTPG